MCPWYSLTAQVNPLNCLFNVYWSDLTNSKMHANSSVQQQEHVYVFH